MNQGIRNLIAQRLREKVYGEIFLASWDESRIAWEDSTLSSMYHDDFEKFDQILLDVCEGTGYFIELINSCEGTICQG